MEDFKVLFTLPILLYLLLPLLAASPYHCPISFCGSNAYSIRFPFRVVGQQHGICGYPGFNLRCDQQGKLLLNLPNSGDFSVRAIDYQSQIIQIYDPSGCSAARRLTLDLSNSPFWGSPSKNYTLLSCPNEVDLSGYITVGCLSNSTHSILATSSESFAMNRAKQTASVGGTCGYTNTTKQEITCFENTKKGNKHQMIALIIVSIALALPAIAASIALACYIRRDRRRVATWDARNTTNGTTTLTPDTSPSIVIGLDQLTIESYTKVILGESKRLPGHEDATCSICLAEYNVKEIVRCIPECRHCFHADCIDEWLKVRGTCPVCRNSPSPARVNL